MSDIIDEFLLKKLKRNEYHANYRKNRRLVDDEFRLKTNQSAREANKKRYDNDEEHRLLKNQKSRERYAKKKNLPATVSD